MNILIVDDAAFARLALRKIVEEGGHTVVAEASDGFKALEEYKLYKPELVLMDITMPECNGIESLRMIKAYDPNMKAIVCSSMGQQDYIVDAVQSGAKDFIVKPYNAERLLDSIKKVGGR